MQSVSISSMFLIILLPYHRIRIYHKISHSHYSLSSEGMRIRRENKTNLFFDLFSKQNTFGDET